MVGLGARVGRAGRRSSSGCPTVLSDSHPSSPPTCCSSCPATPGRRRTGQHRNLVLLRAALADLGLIACRARAGPDDDRVRREPRCRRARCRSRACPTWPGSSGASPCLRRSRRSRSPRPSWPTNTEGPPRTAAPDPRCRVERPAVLATDQGRLVALGYGGSSTHRHLRRGDPPGGRRLPGRQRTDRRRRDRSRRRHGRSTPPGPAHARRADPRRDRETPTPCALRCLSAGRRSARSTWCSPTVRHRRRRRSSTLLAACRRQGDVLRRGGGGRHRARDPAQT